MSDRLRVDAYTCTLCGATEPLVAINGKLCRPRGWSFPHGKGVHLYGLCVECRFGKDERPIDISDFIG